MCNLPPAVISIARKTVGATALALILLATGCTTLPSKLPDIDAAGADARADATQDWNATPALTTRLLALPATLVNATPLPAAVASRAVSLRLPSGASIAQFAALVNAMGLSTVIASSDLAEQPIGVTHFNGTLGDLLHALSATQGVSFAWRAGVLAIGAGTPMIAYLPQNKDLIKAVAGDLASLGATNVTTSKLAGSVAFDAPGARRWRIRRYVKRVASNASTVALQIAIVTVGLSRDRSTGLDWSRLQLTFGHGLKFNFNGNQGDADTGGGIVPTNGNGLPNLNGDNGGSSDSGGDSGTGDGTGDNGGSNSGGSDTGGVSESASTIGAQLASQSLGFVVNGFDFNLKALFSMLSTYGDTRTTQNLVLRTLSGQEVKIRSGESVPYVSGVSVNSTNNGGLLGGTETETVDTGLTLKITPQYNARSRLVTMDVDLQMKSIVGFLQLAAGEQVGSLSRPDVQGQSLKTVARVAAGQTVVLGGLIYDQLTDNRNSLAGLESLPIAHKKKHVQRNALFIIIRPTVTAYAFSDT